MPTDVSRQTYPFSLPDLPYAYDALEPHIDEKTMKLHHDAHHATYVNKLNEAVKKHTELHKLTLAQLLADPNKLPEAVRGAIVNNGGGHLLHDIFWNVLTPAQARSAEPGGKLGDALRETFGSFAAFRDKFSDAAGKFFASGWVALVRTNASGKLEIMNLKDHTVPRPGEKTVLLIIDVWEHAYYVKYQNRRPEFITAFWNVVNWTFAEERFAADAAARAA